MEFNMKKIKVGMIVEGKVFMVTDDSVHVDLGAHAEGVIYKKGMAFEDIKSCKDLVKEGDEISAKVTKMDDENQQILMSRLDMLREEKHAKLNAELDNIEKFSAKVVRVNRGGLELKYEGMDLFMPASHIDTQRVNPEDYKGQTLEVCVIERKGRKLVVSRREVLKKEQRLAKKEAFDKFNVGDKVSGKVVKLAEFGAFVELGGVQGLVHKSQISHHRTDKVADVLAEGQEVETKIISKDKGKIGLSMKALVETPWQLFAKEAKVGDEVKGKIVRKMATGMLVEIQRDVVGIINKKDYSWDPRVNLAGEVEVGHELTLKILSMDVKNRKMSLSKKHLDYNPWKDVSVKVGEEVSGTVEELQSRGALVKIQGVKAFLPIGEIQSERVNEIAQVLKLEEVVTAVVTNVDKEQWKMSISIKQLEESKQRAEFEDYLENEEEVSNTTLGDVFKDQLEKFKK
jgi:small subunit ribosomal protein S1